MPRCDGWIFTGLIFCLVGCFGCALSDVLCRSSLGANPRGVTDSVVRFSTYVGFSIFSFVVTHALYLACMIVFLNSCIIPSLHDSIS